MENLNSNSPQFLDPQCIFCKIIQSKAPCYKSISIFFFLFLKIKFFNYIYWNYLVFENEKVLAFLDINPLHKGHTLVIPKIHYAYLDQLSPEVKNLKISFFSNNFNQNHFKKYAGALMEVVPMLSKALMKATSTDSFNIMLNRGKTAGQVVFHVHFHIIPRSPNDYLASTWW